MPGTTEILPKVLAIYRTLIDRGYAHFRERSAMVEVDYLTNHRPLAPGQMLVRLQALEEQAAIWVQLEQRQDRIIHLARIRQLRAASCTMKEVSLRHSDLQQAHAQLLDRAVTNNGQFDLLTEAARAHGWLARAYSLNDLLEQKQRHLAIADRIFTHAISKIGHTQFAKYATAIDPDKATTKCPVPADQES